MEFNADLISKLVRGIAGVALIAAGVMYHSYVWLLGAFLLMGAFGIGCGFSGGSCAVTLPEEKNEEKKEKLES
ncbi:MAG TPA: hypothetical protein VHO03_13940 [Ignavibacteriales bacterium]|nr:hypothetical protein [Ignavibacteriales bacterium]